MTDNTTPGSQDLQINPVASTPPVDVSISLGATTSPAAPAAHETPATIEPAATTSSAPVAAPVPADVPVQFVPVTSKPAENSPQNQTENPFSLQANLLDAHPGTPTAEQHAAETTSTVVPPAHNQMRLALAVFAGILILGGVGYGSYWYSNRNTELHDAAPEQTQTAAEDQTSLPTATTEATSQEETDLSLTQALSQDSTQTVLHGSACEQGMTANGVGQCVCDIDSGYFGVNQATSDALAVKLSNNTCASCDLLANRIEVLGKAGDTLSLQLKTQLETTAKEHGCGTALANYDDKIKAAFGAQDWKKYLELSFEKYDISQKNLPQANMLKWKILFAKDLALKLSKDKTTSSKTMEYLKNQITSLQNDLLTKCPSCVDTKKACADMTADYATVARFDKIFDNNQDTVAGSSLTTPPQKKVSRSKTIVTDVNAPDEAATKALDLNTVSFSKIFGSDFYVKNCLKTTTTGDAGTK